MDPEVLPDVDEIQNDDDLQLDRVYPGLEDPEDDGGTPLDDISPTPFFCNATVMKFLADLHFKAPEADVAAWSDAEDFLAKRYGLLDLSGTTDKEKLNHWSKKLGLKAGYPDKYAVELYVSVCDGLWPPSICDLSADVFQNPEVFPAPNPGNILSVSNTVYGFVIAIGGKEPRPWKLLISDTLTILQLERELWCSDGNGLVMNLVKKGIPFEVLYPVSHERGPFPAHPGPELHPTGKEPHLPDYFAYRHDLVGFLQTYPHAHAAALCAGGILWRVAVDALPLPSEDAIVRPFHRAACVSRTIGGENYWSPRLTGEEEQILVGVYRWASSK